MGILLCDVLIRLNLDIILYLLSLACLSMDDANILLMLKDIIFIAVCALVHHNYGLLSASASLTCMP